MIADRGAPGNNGLGHKGLAQRDYEEARNEGGQEVDGFDFHGFLIKSFELVS
jgi:hypothetical protein